ncbi:hypothetical protein ACJ73_03578 [Blastomyces percursus]|uniref:Uncharacterized protein n=1 Tax=Blastomyces percursus TaxID=1658174 RepID=A0A1J9QAG6_9EURO|nr:hypothetical protein ACJ73_03578 [Blastomyces percursus]
MSEADWSPTPPKRSPSHLLPPDQLLNHLNSQSPSPSPSSSPGPQWQHEKLKCIRYCVGNQDEYRALPRFQFWNNFKSWFEETFGRPLKQPDRMISQLIRKHRDKKNAIREECGTARSVTDPDQALDEWIQILDDLEAAMRPAKEDAAAAEENHRQRSRRMQDDMMERRRKRNRERRGDSLASETHTVESGTQSSDIMQGLQAALNLILGEPEFGYCPLVRNENSNIGGGGCRCNLNFNIQIHHDDDKIIALRGKAYATAAPNHGI